DRRAAHQPRLPRPRERGGHPDVPAGVPRRGRRGARRRVKRRRRRRDSKMAESTPLPRIPEGVRRIHLLGVAGTGMGAFAAILKAAGYEVTGSDENVYPPMSE